MHLALAEVEKSIKNVVEKNKSPTMTTELTQQERKPAMPTGIRTVLFIILF